MFLLIFFLLLLGWFLGWIAFHVASAAIHLLLAAAIIALIMHFLRGAGRSTTA